MIDYGPLWRTMKEKGISQYYLTKHGIDQKTIYNLKRNRHIRTSTLEKICKAIGCTPNDVIEFLD